MGSRHGTCRLNNSQKKLNRALTQDLINLSRLYKHQLVVLHRHIEVDELNIVAFELPAMRQTIR